LNKLRSQVQELRVANAEIATEADNRLLLINKLGAYVIKLNIVSIYGGCRQLLAGDREWNKRKLSFASVKLDIGGHHGNGNACE
jgi:hypothetical protein